MKCAVVFGGTGFIGLFLARQLLERGSVDVVYLVDLERVSSKAFDYRRRFVETESRVRELTFDVRSNIDWIPEQEVVLVANFAAVHREPGHDDWEYYETNLKGAENVCEWASKVGCNNLIFTSSISPYGPSEKPKTEESLPVPVTAYGGSKLAAEYIHKAWLAENSQNRNLVIVRPGVVFGPGEGGNVSRLIKAVLGRYFFFMGNKDTRKAGTYVKELCNAMTWVLEKQKAEGRNFTLFNMSMNPGPSMQEYVDAVCSVAGVKRFVPSVPYSLLLAAAYVLDLVARPLGIQHPFSPVRIRKLVRSNNILPKYLADNGYQYQYTLVEAFEDWKRENPSDWE